MAFTSAMLFMQGPKMYLRGRWVVATGFAGCATESKGCEQDDNLRFPAVGMMRFVS